MKSTLHKLKILPCYFGPVVQGVKTFEVRYNDRDYHVGDTLKLCEWSTTGGYTGRRGLEGWRIKIDYGDK